MRIFCLGVVWLSLCSAAGAVGAKESPGTPASVPASASAALAPASDAAPATPAPVAVPEQLPAGNLPAAKLPADTGAAAVKQFPLAQELLVFTSVMSELEPVLINPDIPAQLGQLSHFQFSADAKQKLKALYGKENPLTLKVSRHNKKTAQVHFVLERLDHRNPALGAHLQVSPLVGDIRYSQGLTRRASSERLSTLLLDDGNSLRFGLNDFKISGDQSSGFGALWLGKSRIGVDSISVDNDASDWHLQLKHLALSTQVKKTAAQRVDIDHESSIESIRWGAYRVGPVHMAAHMGPLDGPLVGAFVAQLNQINRKDYGANDAERAKAQRDLLQDLGRKLLRTGVALDIQDLSVQYQGLTAGLNGQLALSRLAEGQDATPQWFKENLWLQLHVHVPKQLVEAVGEIMTRGLLEAKNKTGLPVSEDEVKLAGKVFFRNLVGPLLQKNWLRLEHDVLVSTIEFKGGKLWVNGNSVELPQLAPAPVPEPKPASAPEPVPQALPNADKKE